MPSVWSKILMPEWSLPYNCYEIGNNNQINFNDFQHDISKCPGHTWTPCCEEAALEVLFCLFFTNY